MISDAEGRFNRVSALRGNLRVIRLEESGESGKEGWNGGEEDAKGEARVRVKAVCCGQRDDFHGSWGFVGGPL